jgi:hypothetical protein
MSPNIIMVRKMKEDEACCTYDREEMRTGFLGKTQSKETG